MMTRIYGLAAKNGCTAVGMMIALAVWLWTGISAWGAAGGRPAKELEGAIEQVVAILRDPNLKPVAKRQERLQRLKTVIYPKFDFTEMAKRSLGSHWQKRTAEEQREFVKLFTELIEGAYMDNLEGYDGEKVSITGEKLDQGYAEVATKIATKQGREYSVDYKLHQANGEWRVYDVVIENISLVNNYRAQFNRVVTQTSFEELLRRMKGKQFDEAGKKSASRR